LQRCGGGCVVRRSATSKSGLRPHLDGPWGRNTSRKSAQSARLGINKWRMNHPVQGIITDDVAALMNLIGIGLSVCVRQRDLCLHRLPLCHAKRNSEQYKTNTPCRSVHQYYSLSGTRLSNRPSSLRCVCIADMETKKTGYTAKSSISSYSPEKAKKNLVVHDQRPSNISSSSVYTVEVPEGCRRVSLYVYCLGCVRTEPPGLCLVRLKLGVDYFLSTKMVSNQAEPGRPFLISRSGTLLVEFSTCKSRGLRAWKVGRQA